MTTSHWHAHETPSSRKLALLAAGLRGLQYTGRILYKRAFGGQFAVRYHADGIMHDPRGRCTRSIDAGVLMRLVRRERQVGDGRCRSGYKNRNGNTRPSDRGHGGSTTHVGAIRAVQALSRYRRGRAGGTREALKSRVEHQWRRQPKAVTNVRPEGPPLRQDSAAPRTLARSERCRRVRVAHAGAMATLVRRKGSAAAPRRLLGGGGSRP